MRNLRKMIVSLMVLSLLPALATAGLTNPEGFEGYADTTSWAPTEAGEGWTVQTGPAQLGAAYSGYGQAGKGMGLPATGLAHWFATLDTATNLSQTFTVDFQNIDATSGHRRLLIDRGWHYGGASAGVFHFGVYNAQGGTAFEHYATATSSYVKTFFPNGDVGWDGQWHTATVEMNFSNHTVRGKLDSYAFTPWVPMPDNTSIHLPDGGMYVAREIRTVSSSGAWNTDNYNLTPEPATLMLLGAGSLLLLKRKRKS